VPVSWPELHDPTSHRGKWTVRLFLKSETNIHTQVRTSSFGVSIDHDQGQGSSREERILRHIHMHTLHGRCVSVVSPSAIQRSIITSNRTLGNGFQRIYSIDLSPLRLPPQSLQGSLCIRDIRYQRFGRSNLKNHKLLDRGTATTATHARANSITPSVVI
jgi:hypothetical protein